LSPPNCPQFIFEQGHPALPDPRQDRVYGTAVTRRLRAMGIRDKPIAPGSPWQNGFAERLIGSIRRECADHVIALGEAHLRRTLQAYAHYYNAIRTNRSLDTDTPVSRPVHHSCGARCVMTIMSPLPFPLCVH